MDDGVGRLVDESGLRPEGVRSLRPFDPALSARRIDHKPNDALRRWLAAEFERAGLKRNGAVGQAQSWVIPGVAFLAHLHQLARQGVTIYSRPEQLPPQ